MSRRHAPSTLAHLSRAALALLGAAVVTAAMLWFLGILNTRMTVEAPAVPAIRTVLMDSVQADEARPNESMPEPQPQPQTEQIMTVPLDMPAPDVSPQPLELVLNIPTPTLEPVRVAMQPQQVRAPSPRSVTQSQSTAPAQPTADTGPMDADRVDHPPRELAGNPRPTYPIREQRRGIEAVVRLKLLIDERGAVQDVQVIDGPNAFRRAVLQVAHRWRFTPARHNGSVVKVWGVKTIRFELQG